MHEQDRAEPGCRAQSHSVGFMDTVQQHMSLPLKNASKSMCADVGVIGGKDEF